MPTPTPRKTPSTAVATGEGDYQLNEDNRRPMHTKISIWKFQPDPLSLRLALGKLPLLPPRKS